MNNNSFDNNYETLSTNNIQTNEADVYISTP